MRRMHAISNQIIFLIRSQVGRRSGDRLRLRREVRAALPPAIDVAFVSDRTATIRASLLDLQCSLLIGGVLVVIVVSFFLRSSRATLVPAIAAPVSLLGAAVVMYFMHFSLDDVSLMALITATGLVIDDSIIVLENVWRRIERGETRVRAALQGAGEVNFTIVAISISLVAAYSPFFLRAILLDAFSASLR